MTDPRRRRAPLDHRDYRLLWTSVTLSDLGDSLGRVALVIVVFGETGSALAAALVPALSVVPFLGPGQFLTAYLDRYARRSVLVGTDVVRAACFAAMVLPIGTPARLGLLLLASLAEPPFLAVRRSLVPGTLPEAHLDAGVRMLSVSTEVALLGGAVLGGVLTEHLGATFVLTLNAITFVVSAALLGRLRAGSSSAHEEPKGIIRILGEGWDALRGDRIVRLAWLAFPAITAGALAVEATLAPFVADELGYGEAWVGFLSAAISIGVVGGAAIRPRGDGPTELLAQLWQLGGLGAAVALGAFALPAGAVSAVAAYAAIGLVYSTRVPAQVLYSRRLPEQSLAAASTISDALFAAVVLVTSVGGGLAVDVLGARPVVLVASGLGLVACAAAALAARRVSPSTPG